MAVAQANAVDPASGAAVMPRLSKRTRIRALRNELEDAWCCREGLVPVRSPARAGGLCFLNVIFPGVGTMISGCCATKPREEDPAAADTAGDPLAGDEDDDF